MNGLVANKIDEFETKNKAISREITPEEIGVVIDKTAADKYRSITRSMAMIEKELKDDEPSPARRAILEKQLDGFKVRRNYIEELFYKL